MTADKRPKAWSGRRESNPHEKLGKLSGYHYITPALVGGSSGQLISNMIAMHMTETLNWSMAAALASLLLAGVLILYWVYDQLVGIDKLKLG